MEDSPPGRDPLKGVNRGANLAEDVTYSGIVSAAMEGGLAGVRSIALSQAMADYTVGSGRISARRGDTAPTSSGGSRRSGRAPANGRRAC